MYEVCPTLTGTASSKLESDREEIYRGGEGTYTASESDPLTFCPPL